MKEIKIVGKRKPIKVDLESAQGFMRLVNVLRKGKPFLPKGVHRFKTFEESNQWSLKMMARNYKPERQNPKTS